MGYEEMSDLEYRQLPAEVQFQVEEKMTEAGKPTRVFSWGKYKDEHHLLSGLQERAVRDFEFTQQFIMATLTDQQKMKEMQQMYKKQLELQPPISRDQAKEEMGEWIADYFDDAGYDNWEAQSLFFKAMIMNAFPPIDDLDGIKPNYGNMSLEKMEGHMTKFMAIMDNHISSAKRQMKSGVSAGSLLNLLMRR